MDNRFDEYILKMHEALPIGQSFDVLERKFVIGGRSASMFFAEGLTSGEKTQWLLEYLLALKDKEVSQAKSTEDFIEQNMPFLSCSTETKMESILKSLFSGLVPLIIDGFDKVIIIDERYYPARGVEEPEKEKTLRGAKDGFTESIMTNIALIRRRIRDHRLVFEHHAVGEITQTDTCIVFMKGIADESIVKRLGQKIDQLDINTVTVGEQTIVEALGEKEGEKKGRINWLNPFPKVRYTQRPDVVAAHITEGKIAIMIDNSPTIILLPTGIFDFMQDVDDYYFPAMTGNYFRLLRILNFILILFLTPIYLLIVDGYVSTYKFMEFAIPTNDYAIMLFWQFIILEIAIDALKLASMAISNIINWKLPSTRLNWLR